MVKSTLIALTAIPLFFLPPQESNSKILYHLNKTGQDNFRITLSNIENLYKGMPDQQLQITLLLQGESIQLLGSAMKNYKFKQRLKRLRENGVNVEISKDNYEKNRHSIDITPPPKIVDNIFSRIIELQNLGYEYITP